MRRNVLKRTLSEDIVWASLMNEAYAANESLGIVGTGTA
jgi:hypothetical protein